MDQSSNSVFSVRYEYIDVLKGLAIIAVVWNHIGFIFSINEKISFYSTSLFTFLGGITSYYALQRTNNIDVKTYICIRIKKLFNFSIAPPFYFIIFYLQLLMISPFLYFRIKKSSKSLAKIFLNTTIVFILSYTFTKYTIVLNAYGGGRVLLGGSYFFLFFLGLQFAFFNIHLKKSKIVLFLFIISSVCLVTYGIVFLQGETKRLNNITPLWDINPPGIELIIYSILIFISFWALCSLLSSKNIFLRALKFLGQNSMHIFLYHMIFIDFYGHYNFPCYGSVFFDYLWSGIILITSCLMAAFLGKGIGAGLKYLQKIIKMKIMEN